ncbi:MAG: hypothetical protein II917_01915, partial [Synergistaceae bacterium]|nr:hypothetical protein [Synergistaceae bacterium]
LFALRYAYFASKLDYFTHYYSGMTRPVTILATVSFLVGFKHLNIKFNKLINIFASATFGVYLIHEHYMMRHFLWLNLFHNANFQDSPYLIPYSIFAVLLVYIFCTLIELTRSKIFRIISGGRLS